MDNLLPKLVAMSHNDAHNYLMSLDLPVDLRVSLAEKVSAYRKLKGKANKQAKLTQVYHAELWHRLIAPLKYELSNAKVGRELKDFSDAPERHKAFSEYITLMEKLLAGLQKLQIDEGSKASVSVFERGNADPKARTEYAKTPAEIAQARELPNKGAHWTNWINERTKNRIRELFDGIPYTGKKRPVPFAYRIPPAMFKRDLAALQKRTIKEYDIAKQELEMLRKAMDVATPEQYEQEVKLDDTLRRMQFVLKHITYHMKNEPLPPTWHGLAHLYEPPTKPVEKLVEDWDNEDNLIETLRLALQLVEPEPPKKKTNRPKRYRT
jgi:hypothetical protein